MPLQLPVAARNGEAVREVGVRAAPAAERQVVDAARFMKQVGLLAAE